MPKRVLWRRTLIAGSFVHLTYATPHIPRDVITERIDADSTDP